MDPRIERIAAGREVVQYDRTLTPQMRGIAEAGRRVKAGEGWCERCNRKLAKTKRYGVNVLSWGHVALTCHRCLEERDLEDLIREALAGQPVTDADVAAFDRKVAAGEVPEVPFDLEKREAAKLRLREMFDRVRRDREVA